MIVITGNMDRRRALLAVALGFLQLLPRAPELRLLHRWLDTWTGLGLVVVGVERQGLRFSLSHITKGEWWRRSWPSVVLPTIRASTNSRNGWRVESKE